MRPLSIVQLSYGIPGVLAYIPVILAMRAMRRILSRSFITIYAITAVINIATWINSWIALRLRTEPHWDAFYGWVASNTVIRTILLFLINHFYYAQNACVLLLSFDRFAVIFGISGSMKWWNDIHLIVVICAQVTCLLIHLATRFTLNGWILYYEESDFFLFFRGAMYKLDPSIPASVIQLSIGISTFLICSILNVISLKKIASFRSSISTSREVSFLLITMCIFIAQIGNLLVLAFHTAGLVFYENDDTGHFPFRIQITEVMYFTSDCFSVGPAYYTLALPGPIRRHVYHTIKSTVERHVQISDASGNADSSARNVAT